jgi:putative transcriptional regulator
MIDKKNIVFYNRKEEVRDMIHSKLSTLIGQKRMNIQDVCNETGLARNTIAFLYKDKVKRIDYETLDKLCKLFGCQVGDLLEYEE